MAGIYIHIPFCKTRCIYCDFYSTTRSELKQQYIRALCTELKTRKGYLKEEPIETIYFGGGTPSQLAHEDFEQIFQTIKEVYGTEHAEEITLEANPDDLTEEYVSMLRTLPFNRISMGIQTFDAGTMPRKPSQPYTASAKPASGISASTSSMDYRMKQTNGGNATCNKPSALMWSISPLII